MSRPQLRRRRARANSWKRQHRLSAGYFRTLCVEALEYRALLSSSPVISATSLDPTPTLKATASAKDPQSKVWQHDGLWWSVFPVSTGTWVFRLDGTAWTPVLKISGSKFPADIKPVGDGTVAHVFLFNSSSTSMSKLASLEYVPGSPGTYQFWQVRPALSSVWTTDANTGTIDIDSTARMWLATDTATTIEVRYSDYPYSTWSGPITLATGVGLNVHGSPTSEITAVTALPNGTVGVMWSNHTAGRFGFRTHVDGADPTVWGADEVPASQSAQNVGDGMADDHIHLSVSSAGVLYAAVKTGYDKNTIALPEMALLVRHPAAGAQPAYWDPLYGIDAHGTRPIDVVNDAQGYVMIAYAGNTGVNDIVYKAISFADIDPNNPSKFFNTPRQTLLTGLNYKNVNSQRGAFNTDLVLIAGQDVDGENTNLSGARATSTLVVFNDPPVNTVPGTQTILEDASLTFSSAGGNRISVFDPNVVSGNLNVTLTITGGTATIGANNLVVVGNGASLIGATGTPSALNAALDGLVFTPTRDLNGTAAAAIQIITNDLGNTGVGGPLTDTDTVTINITGVNDRPSFARGGNVDVNEDAPAQSINAWATNISAGPANELSQVLSFIVANDNPALFAVQPGVNATNGALSFTPATNANGVANLTIILTDNGGTANGGLDTSAAQTFTITVAAVNDAPVLDNSGSPSLASVTDAAGMLVSSLIASVAPLDMITDVDAGALEGLAIIGVDVTNGVWQFSTNNGSNWFDLGTASISNARLLASDANTRVRFTPNGGSTGTVGTAITFRAWDQTSGTNGGTADTSNSGLATAFSAAAETASISGTQAGFAKSAGQGGVNPDDEGRGIAVDAAGNTYVAGNFFYSDRATDSTTTATGDIFVAKYGVDGTLVWQRIVGSSGDDRGHGIARDSLGNLYVTGGFQGTVDFDPGAGVTNLTSAGDFDTFILKLNSDGLFQWARAVGGSSTDVAFGIAVDSDDNLLVTGEFAGTADFDPGAATLNLKSAGSSDIFVLKLTSSGDLVWADRMGAGSADRGVAVTTDAQNRVYTTGMFRGPADFDPGVGSVILTSVGVSDVFVSRLNSNGTFSFARQMGGIDADGGHDIKVDASGNIYTTGFFTDTADFDPNPNVAYNLVGAGSVDIFVSKLDSSGNFVFADQIGGTGDDRGRGLAVESNGNVAVVGHFTGTVDFDPGSGVTNLASAGSNDIFVAQLSSSGSYVSAQRFGSTLSDMGRAITRDAANNLYVTGFFIGSFSFDTGNGVFALSSAGVRDIFVARIVPPGGAAPLAMLARSPAAPNATNTTSKTAPSAPVRPAVVAPPSAYLSAVSLIFGNLGSTKTTTTRKPFIRFDQTPSLREVNLLRDVSPRIGPMPPASS